jgi:peptidase MA superfamily protein
MKFFLSHMSKIFIFAGLFLVFAVASLKAEKTVMDFRDVYKIYYQQDDSLVVKRLLQKTEKQISKIENFFGLKRKSEIHIYLTKSESEFQSYAVDGFPEWAQAIAFVNKKIIIIRVANADEANRLPQVFLHELVHIYLGIQYSGTDLPTWLHEGIAQWLSNENLDVDEQVLIANALYGNKLNSLTSLDSMFAFSPVKARLGYALARSAIDYFTREYDDAALLDILNYLEKKQSLNGAFKKATGRDFVDFEIGWFAFIDEKYSWMILLNIPDLVWVFLVFLFFAAIIRRHYKNKKTIRSWPEEPNENDNVLN